MKIQIDHDSSTPLYVQLEQQLRRMISRNECKDGSLIPPETAIAADLGLSRATVRQAINGLVVDGLLTRRKGSGTVVTRKAISSKGSNWMSFSQEMAKEGVKVRNYELHISWPRAGAAVAAFFSIPEGTRVLCLERLRGNQDIPFVQFVSYFNPSLGMTGEEDFSRPLYDILRNDYGVDVDLSQEEIKASAADSRQADKLGIESGSPLLVRQRRVYDTEGRPVEWNIGYYRADSFTYYIEFKK